MSGGASLHELTQQASEVLDKHPVESIDVAAVNKKETRELYKKRTKIHPKLVHGTFRKVKWAVMILLLGIYYLAPWLRFDRGAGVPDQAILVDFANRRFYFFFIEIWPQEIYYATGLLILAAFGLFLVTSVAGRVWCGYACPQTVWTDLFIYVERLFEGDRAARLRLDQKPWTAGKIAVKTGKHLSWLVIALATGGAWVFYFVDAPTLAGQLLDFSADPVNYIIIGGLTFTTYWLGGMMREQVCTYMCPWPRIQGAMLDEESLVVTYRAFRGEPRGPLKKGGIAAGNGDCIDCKQCVAACPMGIDIRDGNQLECINCALCIDACDDVMARIAKPKGLIAYDTLPNLARRAKGENPRLRLLRPRVILYLILMSLVAAFMAFQLAGRSDYEVNLLHDRNPLFVQLSDGSVRNGYTLKLLNQSHEARRFTLTVGQLDGALITVAGQDAPPSTSVELPVPSNAVATFRLFIAAPASSIGGEARDIELKFQEVGSGLAFSHDTAFRGP